MTSRCPYDGAMEVFCSLVRHQLRQRADDAVGLAARDERRIAQVLRHIEDHAAEQLNLDGLAKIAAMSKYHFLRTFQRIVGMSPYQFLLLVRTRRAAVRLVISSETVSTIAFEAGFGDLSSFNKRFRDLFG